MYQLSAQIAQGSVDVDTVGAAKVLNYTVYNSEGGVMASHPLTTGVGDAATSANVGYQIEGDGLYMMDSPHNVTLDVFQVLIPYTSLSNDDYPVYADAVPVLEFSSNTLYQLSDFVGDGFHGVEMSAVATGDVFEVPLVLNVDPTAMDEHSLQILGNGMLIDFSDLEDISAKVKGVESIEVRGTNNSISIRLDDVAQMNNSHTLQILGSSSNDINVDLTGLGFTSTITDGFITYTNGTYSIIVDQHLNQGGIIL